MKGGAVNDDKSPEKDAMDFKKAVQEPLFCAETPAPSASFEDIVWGIAEGDRVFEGVESGRVGMCK